MADFCVTISLAVSMDSNFMNKSNLSSLIWSSTDDELRGVFEHSKYGTIVLLFTVLKRLDCVLESVKDKFYNLYKQLKDTLSHRANGLEWCTK